MPEWMSRATTVNGCLTGKENYMNKLRITIMGAGVLMSALFVSGGLNRPVHAGSDPGLIYGCGVGVRIVEEDLLDKGGLAEVSGGC